jgi:cytochrome c peroxidase
MVTRHVWSLAAVAAAAASLGASQASAQALTAEQALGKSLFFDTSLSHAGNQACASCHSPSVAFTDPDKSHATSKGSDPSLFGNRNAPSAMYMAYSPTFYYDTAQGLYIGGQFDDGRAATLEDQAKGPFVNPVEMGNADRAEVIQRLQASPNAAAFQAVFGANAFSDVDTAYDNIANAIASYERTSELSPFTSKFDYYLDGKAKLTAQEAHGLELFNSPTGGNCSACHISDVAADGTHPLFTDFTYDNIGIPKNYASDFLNDPPQFNPAGQNFLDYGLGAQVGDPSLYGHFKVTTLRNIALTGPYGHNGYFQTLDQVVDFYATRDVKPTCVDPTTSATQAEALGCWPMAEFFDTMNVDELGDLPLNAQDKADIVAFLGTLSDGYAPSAIPEPAAWMLMISGAGLTGLALRSRRRKVA